MRRPEQIRRVGGEEEEKEGWRRRRRKGRTYRVSFALLLLALSPFPVCGVSLWRVSVMHKTPPACPVSGR